MGPLRAIARQCGSRTWPRSRATGICDGDARLHTARSPIVLPASLVRPVFRTLRYRAIAAVHSQQTTVSGRKASSAEAGFQSIVQGEATSTPVQDLFKLDGKVALVTGGSR